MHRYGHPRRQPFHYAFRLLRAHCKESSYGQHQHVGRAYRLGLLVREGLAYIAHVHGPDAVIGVYYVDDVRAPETSSLRIMPGRHGRYFEWMRTAVTDYHPSPGIMIVVFMTAQDPVRRQTVRHLRPRNGTCFVRIADQRITALAQHHT